MRSRKNFWPSIAMRVKKTGKNAAIKKRKTVKKAGLFCVTW
jgi:hypothetical protein